jgi:hypothetical protein
MFHRKISKFMDQLKAEMQSVLTCKNFDSYISRLPTQAIGTHSGFYFYDENPKIHINQYPNLNINYNEYCMEFALNSETKSSVKRIITLLKNEPEKIDVALRKTPEMKLQIYYKLQYLPMDNFVWNLIPGFPKDTKNLQPLKIFEEIEAFEKMWDNFKGTILYQMESGRLRHSSGRMFNKTEMDFAKGKNPKPNYAIRFGKQYAAEHMANKQKGIVTFFKNEITKLMPLIELVIG